MSKNHSFLRTVLILVTSLALNSESATAQQAQQHETVVSRRFDIASINGSWKLIKGTLAGRELPKEQLESIRLGINNGAYETHGTGFVESGKMVIPIPVTGKPQAIDVVIEKGDNAGSTMQGIVRIEGEKLTVCYAISGERPMRFESTEAEQNLFLEYEKIDSEMMTIVTPHVIVQEEEELIPINNGSGGNDKK